MLFVSIISHLGDLNDESLEMAVNYSMFIVVLIL